MTNLVVVDAMNTYNTALQVLLESGFRISIVPTEIDCAPYRWCAEIEGRKFIASDPLRLLAIVRIWQLRGDKWNEPISIDHYDRFLDEAFPEKSEP